MKKDHTLWGCGCNHYGEHGMSKCNIPAKYPEKLLDNVKLMTIGLGGVYAFVQKTDQTLWWSGDMGFPLPWGAPRQVEFGQISF